uniref:Uncharacterized protein n=1 Tax=Rhizophora mucronata TaxID=61149 RepID=A0A2P2PS01_RHIMU
MTYQLTNKI